MYFRNFAAMEINFQPFSLVKSYFSWMKSTIFRGEILVFTGEIHHFPIFSRFSPVKCSIFPTGDLESLRSSQLSGLAGDLLTEASSDPRCQRLREDGQIYRCSVRRVPDGGCQRVPGPAGNGASKVIIFMNYPYLDGHMIAM
jgi:hypothetical protein